ncbi:MAG: hypothetical protein KF838_11130 [Phycisphaeraceae bacterium]|nr:MAG: hypothetical protein KF838_11130 [Phycisphaeraceae bacterium]
MASPVAERAIADATAVGRALLKFISPNDVGITGSHQCGFYLPKDVWQLFTPHPPETGENQKSWPKVLWQDGRVTESCVTWYGSGTRSEYRLTRFGKEFPFLSDDTVGNLLVLIPKSHDEFIAYVLDTDDDIADVQSALGVEIEFGSRRTWGIFDSAAAAPPETPESCIERHFREFQTNLEAFPPTIQFSNAARQALLDCVKEFAKHSPDDRLMACMDVEYRLFQHVERQLCQNDIQRLFKSVDDFLSTASSILNRRKSRAGKSLEHHVEHLLREEGIPFASKPSVVEGEPDILIPSVEAYLNPKYPLDRLCMIGVKTTCKDRWRQVLNEAQRMTRRHILTIQPGISSNQMEEMRKAGVSLIVPKRLHKDYPPDRKLQIYDVADFLKYAKTIVT